MATEPREIWGDLAATAFVRASLLFRTLDDDALEDLLKLGRLQSFAAGEVVARQGDDGGGDDFLLVLDGLAAITAEREGRAVELGSLGRGACFGELGALADAAPVATVTARTQLEVVRFPAPMVGALAGRFPRLKKLLEALREARRKEADGEPPG